MAFYYYVRNNLKRESVCECKLQISESVDKKKEKERKVAFEKNAAHLRPCN